MFNKLNKKQSTTAETLSKKRDKVCLPIAKEILSMIAKYEKVEVGMGNINPANVKKEYAELCKDVLTLMLKEDIKISEVSYIFRVVLQPYNFVKEIVEQSMNEHMKESMEKIWGKDELDVRMSEIDDLLTGRRKMVVDENLPVEENKN